MNRPLSAAAAALVVAPSFAPGFALVFALVFGLGLAAIGWVATSYLGTSPLALTMTLLIGAVYALGAVELWRFQQATQTLRVALAELAASVVPADPSPRLADWLDRLHPALRPAVRLRIEGERAALPGPALTPYLVGLLVLLGMLGTFLGMVVTLNGAALALDSTTDLATIRAALAAPVKGLGLAFGTSVAGVAASAMLGLISALCRRDRLQAAQALDTQIATRLRGFSLAHQREQTLQTLQQQSRQTPELLAQVQALMAEMQRQGEQAAARLQSSQDRFHAHAQSTYAALAASVDRSLQHSLTESARLAGATIQPLVEATMTGIARETAGFQQRMAETMAQTLTQWSAQFERQSAALMAATNQAQAQLHAEASAQDRQRLAAWTQTLAAAGHKWQAQAAAQARSSREEMSRLIEVAAEALRAAAGLVAELRQQLSDSLVRDTEMLAERGRIMAELGSLLETLKEASSEQRSAVDALVANAAATLQRAGHRFGERVDAEAEKTAAAAAEVTASAVEVASLSEAFGLAVQMFSASSAALTGQLQRIEAALGKSTARSDEQLAYYVAQAREIVDLSIAAQQQIVDDLRQLAQRPARLADELA